MSNKKKHRHNTSSTDTEESSESNEETPERVTKKDIDNVYKEYENNVAKLKKSRCYVVLMTTEELQHYDDMILKFQKHRLKNLALKRIATDTKKPTKRIDLSDPCIKSRFDPVKAKKMLKLERAIKDVIDEFNDR